MRLSCIVLRRQGEFLFQNFADQKQAEANRADGLAEAPKPIRPEADGEASKGDREQSLGEVGHGSWCSVLVCGLNPGTVSDAGQSG